MRNILRLPLLGLALLGLALCAPGLGHASDFGQKEKATVNHPDSGSGLMGGSSGAVKPQPKGSPEGTAPPDERTGNYLPGSEGVQRYNQQMPNKGVVPPLGGNNEAPSSPDSLGGSAGDQGQAKGQ
jgi:hypothetical protein